MKKPVFKTVVMTMVSLLLFSGLHAASEGSKSAVPLPPALENLRQIQADVWVQVDAGEAFLEGPAFDRQGNLYVSSIFDNRIIKITPDKKITTVFQQDGLMPDGIAIHKDGRLFLACLSGKLAVINPDGSGFSVMNAQAQGFPKCLNDLVFDEKGNLYVTDFIGTASEATGGVYRYSADFSTVQPVFKNLASANGIAFHGHTNVLWFSETGRNALHRVEFLEDGVTINPVAGAGIPYRFTGGPGGCDSMAMDAAGNIYQAMIFQGRYLILNSGGIPVAQVLIPGRDKGGLLRTTNVAFKPGTNEAYATVSGKGGAFIFTFKGLEKGYPLFSHQ